MRKKLLAGLMILVQVALGISYIIPVHADSTVVISAVQITGGVGKTAEDFIELFNPTNQPVNLKGFRLVKRTATATADASIKSWTEDTFIPA